MRDLMLALHLRAIARLLEKDPEALHRLLRTAPPRKAAPRASRLRQALAVARRLLHARRQKR